MTAASAAALPYIPSSADTVLQRVPSMTDPRVRRFNQLRAELERAPRDEGRALALSRAYLDYGRSTGDARYLGRALAVVEPWMHAKPVPVAILMVHATVLQSRHAFDASRTELREVLRREPRNAQGWLTLASVALVQADYPAANDACVHLAQVSGDLLGILCTSQLRALSGRAPQAYALLSLIENPGDSAPAEIRSYVEGLMADTAARLGQTAEAERHFKAALQWAPADNFLLADYADFLLDRGRPGDVKALLAQDVESDTSFLRLVLAEVALPDPKASRDIDAMRARFAALGQRGSELYQREQAIFELHVEHDSARALEIARQNWNVQRAPPDMRILLEAALAAHQPQAAAPVRALIIASHLQDPVIDRLTVQLAALPGVEATDSRAVAMAEARP
ncbi:MAG TPA: hypothetical protein VGI35_01665 [Steroidobacteraceae bacterium]